VIDARGWCDSSLAIDAANSVHLAYYGNSASTGELRYANNASGSWVQETTDSFPQDIGCSGQSGGSLSLAVGTDGTAHVAYSGRYPDYGLKYAVKTDGAWNVDTVDSGYVPHLSSAVDLAGTAHIAYADNSGQLKYAHPDGTGNWHVETIESGNASAPSIALDAAGRVHISYVAGYQLKYATNAGGTWSGTILDGNAHSGNLLNHDVKPWGVPPCPNIGMYQDLPANGTATDRFIGAGKFGSRMIIDISVPEAPSGKFSIQIPKILVDGLPFVPAPVEFIDTVGDWEIYPLNC
jgi:hypothetical protein